MWPAAQRLGPCQRLQAGKDGWLQEHGVFVIASAPLPLADQAVSVGFNMSEVTGALHHLVSLQAGLQTGTDRPCR